MSAAQFRDLTKVRIAIEGHAAAQAALHRAKRDLVSIARAEEADAGRERIADARLPRAVESNKTFHFAVYEAAHSPILVEIIRALWLKAGPVINLDLRANPTGWRRATRSGFTPMCVKPSPPATLLRR